MVARPKTVFKEFDDLLLVLTHLEDHWRTADLLLAKLGCRYSEMGALHRDRISLDEEMITITHNLILKKGVSQRQISYRKGKRSNTVPMAPGVADLLHDWMEKSPAGETCGLIHESGDRYTADLLFRLYAGDDLSDVAHIKSAMGRVFGGSMTTAKNKW